MSARGAAKTRATGARYTRADVARVLGVTRRTVQRLEEAGELRPTVRKGVHEFDAEVVHALAARRQSSAPMSDGELAAVIFERLEANKGISEIVRELRVHPRLVRQLHGEWKLELEAGYALRLEAGRC